MQKRVWAVVKDPGGTNGVLPVVKILRERGIHVDLIAHGKAIELPQVKELGTYLVAGRNPVEVVDTLPLPDAYITSMCSEGGVGRDLIPYLHARNIPTITAQDFWGGGLVKFFSNPMHWPDYIWVNDELGAELVRRAWSRLQKIWVTGYPALDKYAQVDVEATRVRIRTQLGVQAGVPLVLYAGRLRGTGQELCEIAHVLSVLAQEGLPVAFAPRQHPRMRNDAGEEIEPWNQALAALEGVQLFADTATIDTPEMVATADVVIAAFSSVLIEAACLRKEVIAINDEVAMTMFKTSAGGIMAEDPLVELGCARKVTSFVELREVLRAALKTGLGLRAAQEKHFQLDAKNAERAANYVLALLE